MSSNTASSGKGRGKNPKTKAKRREPERKESIKKGGVRRGKYGGETWRQRKTIVRESARSAEQN